MWEVLHFLNQFGDMRLKTSKVASRWPRHATRWFQDRPKSPKEAPRRPQEEPSSPQDGPKTAPRQLQDGSESLPFRLFSYGFSNVFATLGHLTSNLSPTCLQDAILLAKLPPRWLQVASKTSGGGPLGCPLCQTTVLKVFAFIQDGRFLSDPVACNMSPLGRRRGPALRA